MLNGATTDSARIRAHIGIASTLTTTNYKKALEHATLAVGLSEKTGDQSAMIESYKLAGGVSLYKGLYDLAVNFFNKQYDLAKKVGDEVEAGMAYFNLGSVSIMMEDYGEAGKYFRGAYQMLEAGHQKKSIPMPEITLVTYWMNMALIYWSEGDIRRGDSMLTRCMPMVNDRPGMEDKRMSIHHIRALLYLKSKRLKDALYELALSRDLAVRLSNLPDIPSTAVRRSSDSDDQSAGQTAFLLLHRADPRLHGTGETTGRRDCRFDRVPFVRDEICLAGDHRRASVLGAGV
jgi:tetratricopeptide (TPR) repeat protein